MASPDRPKPSIEPRNECDVLTIFPMGAKCFSKEPTNVTTFNGSIAVGVTGGTPPYTISWENGNVAPAITNLGVGEYPVTITDSYGDFIVNTTCILSATALPTPTPTGTPTPTPTPTITPTPTLTPTATPIPSLTPSATPEPIICFTTEYEFLGPIYTTIPSTGLYNGKYYYTLVGVGGNAYVWWNSTLNRWEMTLVLGGGLLLAYLPSTNSFPVDNTVDWVSERVTYMLTSYGLCSYPPTDMCFTVVKNGTTPIIITSNAYVAGTYNNKFYYGVYNPLTSPPSLIGYVFWDDVDNRWEFWQIFNPTAGPSGSYYSYLSNSSDYPNSTITENWINNPSVIYGINESTLGHCV